MADPHEGDVAAPVIDLGLQARSRCPRAQRDRSDDAVDGHRLAPLASPDRLGAVGFDLRRQFGRLDLVLGSSPPRPPAGHTGQGSRRPVPVRTSGPRGPDSGGDDRRPARCRINRVGGTSPPGSDGSTRCDHRGGSDRRRGWHRPPPGVCSDINRALHRDHRCQPRRARAYHLGFRTRRLSTAHVRASGLDRSAVLRGSSHSSRCGGHRPLGDPRRRGIAPGRSEPE